MSFLSLLIQSELINFNTDMKLSNTLKIVMSNVLLLIVKFPLGKY
jgi:hypothetical protein